MIFKTLLLIFMVSFVSLFADEIPVKVNDPVIKTSADSLANVTKNDSIDVFIDKNGDGIADNRNFLERNRNWRQNLDISKRFLGQKKGTPGYQGQIGKKAKKENSGGGGHGGG